MESVKQGHAIELYHQDGHTAGIFYCSECRIVHLTKLAADRCHGTGKCEKCGEVVRFGVVCSACQGQEFREKEQKRIAELFEKAEKIPAADHDGFVFYEKASHNNGYFESVEDFIEWTEYYPEHRPAYVWSCESHPPRLADVSDVTESIISEMWEDADESDLYGVPELAAAIDAFNEANKDVQIYEPDFTKAVILNWAAEEASK
jgi:hypothetical protein